MWWMNSGKENTNPPPFSTLLHKKKDKVKSWMQEFYDEL